MTDKIVMQRGVFFPTMDDYAQESGRHSCWTSRVLYAKLDLAERGFSFNAAERAASTCA